MISLILWDLRWRAALLAAVAVILYFLEPGFHQHEQFDPAAVALGPVGVSAALAHLAALSMILLLAGFIANDRQFGYTRLFFSHPTSPLAYYGLRWALAYAISILAALAFLVLGQMIAWGTFLGGWQGLILPVTTGLVYGGLMAFLSSVLPRGDAWIAFLLFALPTFFPQVLSLALDAVTLTVRETILTLLPPITAIQAIWDGLLVGAFAWGAFLLAAAYGVVLLGAAGFIIRLREWP